MNPPSHTANPKHSVSKVSYSKAFKRDLLDLAKRQPQVLVSEKYITAIHCLLTRTPLPASYVNHPMIGNWSGYFDCHIQGDLVLIYKYVDDELRLARLNTHAQIAI